MTYRSERGFLPAASVIAFVFKTVPSISNRREKMRGDEKFLRRSSSGRSLWPRMRQDGDRIMAAEISRSTGKAGFWSAVLATVFSVAYVVAQLAEWVGVLGSGGGPESSSTALGLVLLLTPSFFLGSSFLVLMVTVHQLAVADLKAWSHAAVAFATIYAALTGTVYFVQLTFVLPHIVAGRVDGIEPFLFTPIDSFFYSVDILGYSFMSLATLFAARIFTGAGVERIVRLFLAANGLLLPFIALQIYGHSLIWIAALWTITFPASTIALAVLFRRSAV
jgi:hypothetical protein